MFYAEHSLNVLVKFTTYQLNGTKRKQAECSRPVSEKVAQISSRLCNSQTAKSFGCTKHPIRLFFLGFAPLLEGKNRSQASCLRFQPTRYLAVNASPRLVTRTTATTIGQTYGRDESAIQKVVPNRRATASEFLLRLTNFRCNQRPVAA